MRVVFGVGNPGPEYDGTRHNLGFRVLDELAAGRVRRWRRLFGLEARCAKVQIAGWPVLLAAPLTQVNRCGPVLAGLRDRLGLADAHLLTVVDDLALPCGAVRLREGGSDGGHNGLRSIAAHLGTAGYPRLRIGIGPAAGPVAAFVLGRFTGAEAPRIEQAVARAVEGVGHWVRRGAAGAMAEVNRRDLDPPPDPS